MFRQVTREANRLRIYFDHTGSGLEPRGGKLEGFEVAAKSGGYEPAEARIEGTTVVLWSARIGSPARVRYAWADDPKATLENGEGLPAGPFRADLK
jgi:sialate O-acetylesterase